MGVRMVPDREDRKTVMLTSPSGYGNDAHIDIVIEMDTSVGRADDVFTVLLCAGG